MSAQRFEIPPGSGGDQRSAVASSRGGRARITEDATSVSILPPRSTSTLSVPSVAVSKPRPRTRVPSSTRVRSSRARSASIKAAVLPTMRIDGGCCAKPVA